MSQSYFPIKIEWTEGPNKGTTEIINTVEKIPVLCAFKIIQTKVEPKPIEISFIEYKLILKFLTSYSDNLRYSQDKTTLIDLINRLRILGDL